VSEFFDLIASPIAANNNPAAILDFFL